MSDVVIDLTADRDDGGSPSPARSGGDDAAALRAVVDRVRAVDGVARVGAGGLGELATYLPGDRIDGIRADGDRLQLSIVASGGVPLVDLAAAVRQAADWPGPVDVTIADLDLSGPDDRFEGDGAADRSGRSAPEREAARQRGIAEAEQLGAAAGDLVPGVAPPRPAGPTDPTMEGTHGR